MEPAFWDSSSLVPLCVRQQATPVARALSKQYDIFVWCAAPVEVGGAFTRLLRMGQLTAAGLVQAQIALEGLRGKWREVLPSDSLRDEAERLIDRFPLRAADALQLAAALSWCIGRPKGRVFISGDRQLLDAARELGFHAVEA